MAQPGDIMDEFDDDQLRRSIESADKDGQWRDPEQKFVDPKLQVLARQLAEVPHANYTERRLQELDRRAASRAARAAEPQKGASTATPAAAKIDAVPTNWRETIVRQRTAAEQRLLAPHVEPRAEPGRSRMFVWARSLGAAVLVFGAALGAQVAIVDWTDELGVRAALAAIVTGCAWQRFGAGRFRAAAIGTVTHLIAFVGTGGASSPTEILATFLGTLVVLLGSGAAGMRNEEKAGDRSPGD